MCVCDQLWYATHISSDNLGKWLIWILLTLPPSHFFNAVGHTNLMSGNISVDGLSCTIGVVPFIYIYFPPTFSELNYKWDPSVPLLGLTGL